MTARHDYYQTDTDLVISIYKKQVQASDLSIVVQNGDQLVVTIGSEPLLELGPLWAFIVPESVESKVFGTKVEIKATKVSPGHWPSLTRAAGSSLPPPLVPASSSNNTTTTPSAIVPPSAPALTTSQPRSSSKPSRSKFDAMNFDADLDSDDDTTGTKGKSEKDLDNFFKTLYGDLDEEGRRAMMKSYVESGGTVLSTDWKDIGQRTVKPQPPQ